MLKYIINYWENIEKSNNKTSGMSCNRNTCPDTSYLLLSRFAVSIYWILLKNVVFLTFFWQFYVNFQLKQGTKILKVVNLSKKKFIYFPNHTYRPEILKYWRPMAYYLIFRCDFIVFWVFSLFSRDTNPVTKSQKFHRSRDQKCDFSVKISKIWENFRT